MSPRARSNAEFAAADAIFGRYHSPTRCQARLHQYDPSRVASRFGEEQDLCSLPSWVPVPTDTLSWHPTGTMSKGFQFARP